MERWENPQEILKAKLDKDMAYRASDIEPEWLVCEEALENAGYNQPDVGGDNAVVHPESSVGNDTEEIRPNANYIFQHYRLLHSQMSANPPVVGAKPLSMDQIDIDAADMAEDTNRYWFKHMNLQENTDQMSGKAIKYGTGYIKTIQDPDAGDMVSFDEETDLAHFEGDAKVYSPSTLDIWLDCMAKTPDDCEHVWEKVTNTYAYWISVFHDERQIEILDNILKENKYSTDSDGMSELSDEINLYYYYEKGLPRNAMLGRFAIMTYEGELITDGVVKNPHFYRPFQSRKDREKYLQGEKGFNKIKKKAPIGKLPIHILTDIDVDDRPYGRSFIYYAANNQDIVNRLDEVTLNNIKAWGSQKCVIIGGGKVNEVSLNDDQFTAITIDGPGDVKPMPRPGSMPDMTQLREVLKGSVDATAAVNKSMTGQMDRETSGSALQVAASQGNQVRRRLFVKYTRVCEEIYRSLNMISRETWTTEKTLEILGAQGSYKTRFVSAMDISGGYQFYSSYGEQFSLDPALRRQELMQLIPLLQEMPGVTQNTIIDLLGINEVEIAQDRAKLGETRQKEIFDEIKRTGKQIQPDPDIEDSDSMLAWASIYVMTSEYNRLGKESKDLLKEHIQLRKAIVAQQSPALAGMQQDPAAGAAGPQATMGAGMAPM